MTDVNTESKDERLKRLALALNEDRKNNRRPVKRIRFTPTKHSEAKVLTVSEAAAIARRRASVKKFNTDEKGVTRKVISTYSNGKFVEVVYHKTIKGGKKLSMTKHEPRNK